MFNVTIAAKTPADLKAMIADLAASMGATEPVEKTLADFSMQEIVEHLESLKPKTLDALLKEDEEQKKADTKKAASSKKAKVETQETLSPAEKPKAAEAAEAAENSAETTDAKSPEELKDAAIKAIMGVYTNPEGKKAAQALLKEFGVKNFHLVPEDRWAEFHTKTMAALKSIA